MKAKPKQGMPDMNRVVRRIGTLLPGVCVALVLASLVGCKGGEDKKEAAASQEAVPMKVVKAEQRPVQVWGEFVAQINAKATVDVRARVEGFLLEKHFKEGDTVEKDQLLFEIDPQTYQEQIKQAQATVNYNRAKLSKAERDFQRFEKLFDEGVVSRDEFEVRQTDMETLKASLSDSQAALRDSQLQLGYTRIHSPLTGVIGKAHVDVGNLVGRGENTLLATVSSTDPVYVNFSISESDYVRAMRNREMRQAQNKDVDALRIILADGSKYEHGGTFDMADRAVDPRTGTLGIRLTFPNPDGLLKPGQYAKLRALLDNIPDALVVPARAVVDVQGVKSLYVVGEDGVVKSVPVKLGPEQQDVVAVTEGIKVGDMIIADGVSRVRPGIKVKPIPVPMSDGDSQKQPQANTEQDKTETSGQNG